MLCFCWVFAYGCLSFCGVVSTLWICVGFRCEFYWLEVRVLCSTIVGDFVGLAVVIGCV